MTGKRDTLRIEPPSWATDPATRGVIGALAAGGAVARFVGGSVRDALLGQPPPGSGAMTDIDIATPAPPERVMELLEKDGIKVVPTGLAHGTVTAIAGTPPRHFEITTLRRDVETYGRRARVSFDADWAADAARRDFTINAIFLDPDGTVHDPMAGLADLRARRVRFVGDPATRIAEDVLRILRYYRFEARFGTGLGDPPARAACRAMANLLPTLSNERVARELVMLLETSDPVGVLEMMREDGVLPIVLPEAQRFDRLRHLIAIEPETDPLRRLAALIEVDGAGAISLAERLRFSNAWRDRLQGLAPPWDIRPAADTSAQRRALYRLGAERYRDIALLLTAEGAMSRDRFAELIALSRDWTPPVFSLTGRDVTALGIPPGPQVGRLLNAVLAWWEAGDFTADHAACLAHLRELVAAGI
ncbi:MAG TPA: CCA tRNA nucleotidyltransferase [Stellaceae bacterium]|jgi:poly(A) polymerase